jgi:hypothetical protein
MTLSADTQTMDNKASISTPDSWQVESAMPIQTLTQTLEATLGQVWDDFYIRPSSSVPRHEAL